MAETLTAPAPSTGSTSVPIGTMTSAPPMSPSAIPSAPAKPGSPLQDAFDTLDNYAKDPDASPTKITPSPVEKRRQDKKAAEAPAPKKEEPKPAEETKPEEEEKKTEETKAETTKPTTPEKPKKPADFLREKLAKTERERDSFKAEVEKYKASKPTEDPQVKALQERFDAQANELQTLREELKYADYSKSSEFKEQYEKPFHDAYANAVKKTTSFKLTDAQGNSRHATQADFDKLVTLDDNSAADLANELFGETKASLILLERDKVLEKAAAQQKVLEDFRKNGAEREKQLQQQHAEQYKRENEIWEKLNTEAKEKHPEFFKPVEGDDKGNQMLERGYARMQAAFNGGKWTDKDGIVHTLSRQELINLHNEMFNKSAGFNAIVHRKDTKINSLQAEVDALKKELEQFKSSEPGKGEGQSKSISDEPEAPSGTMNSLLAGLDKLAK